MSKPEEAVLVCRRVADAPVVIPGSTKDACSGCATPVWVSVASRRIAAEQKAALLCLPCATERAAKVKDVKVEPISEEQWREFRDAVERG